MTDSPEDFAPSPEPEIDLDALTGVDDETPAPEPEISLGDAADDEAPVDDAGELNLDFGADDEAPADDVALNFGDEEPAEPEIVEKAVPEEAELSEEAQRAVEELREHLRFAVGEWFVIHTYSGMERRVEQNLRARVDNSAKPGSVDMNDYIFEIKVPTEEVEEIRGNQKKTITRTVLPGYVLVRMELTDESWAMVRHTPSVTGFVGHGNEPIAIGRDEVERMLLPSVLAAVAPAAGGKRAARKKAVEVEFAVGESVQVDDGGAFTGVHATITEINPQSKRVKVLVEMLGRETPMDLTFDQITKI